MSKAKWTALKHVIVKRVIAINSGVETQVSLNFSVINGSKSQKILREFVNV